MERIIRVDHAGEFGALRIYAGQLAILRRSISAETVRAMQARERQHLEAFSDLMVQRQVRPSALLPLWQLAGFALGAATAVLGERSAMACTVAVEEAIDAHYAHQIEALDETESDLRERIARYRQEERDHRDIGLQHGARGAPFYRLMSAAIKAGCRTAIILSERI